MDLLRWDPFSDLAALRDRVNRVFEESLTRPGERREPAASRSWAPLVDIYETPAEIVLLADIAGVQQDDLDVQVTGDTLTIKGERKPQQDRQYVRVERPYGVFLRSFTIGTPIDQAQVRAHYREGVLEVILPKAAEAHPRQVQVQVD